MMEKSIILIAMLIILINVVHAEKLTTEQLYSQRLISHINYSPLRLKNFCLARNYNFYQPKICRTDNRHSCYAYLNLRKFEYCSDFSKSSIFSLNYSRVFSGMRKYMDDNNLKMVKNSITSESMNEEEVLIILPKDVKEKGGVNIGRSFMSEMWPRMAS